ncbi:MAG: AAA family ATPase [Ruminococcaceae bacterium]|nr:AAA family ATPase [Oscillospiraceae bacterium]
MLKIDQAILDTDKVICKNIDRFDDSERGLLSQNILAQLRNYVEYVAQKIYSNNSDIDPNNYENKKEAWEHIQSHGEYRFLAKFHSLLQKSASHYTLDENGSERLMLKYYEYLLRIKMFLKHTFNLDVLNNIDSFPLDTDDRLMEYYEKISEKICKPSSHASSNSYKERSYIRKIKPFFVDHHIYYEVTFTTANDHSSKFDRVIAFTNIEIIDNYATKLSIHNDFIEVMGKTFPIQIIDSWEVSIRPCEIKNFSRIFGKDLDISPENYEYCDLMKYITSTHMNLVDLVTSSNDYYEKIKHSCTQRVKIVNIFDLLDEIREIIKNNAPGSNVIRYLIYKMNNKVIKLQYDSKKCELLSNLYLKWSCIPFDNMPFTTSPVKHNPHMYDLLDCIDSTGREHEFLIRFVNNNTEQHDMLFTPQKELSQFSNIDNLIKTYNQKIYYKHLHRKLQIYKHHLYLKGYADDTYEVIKKLKDLSATGIFGYSSFIESWLKQNNSYIIDSKEKLEAVKMMFSNSQVALIYGSAGTGKTTLINHISNIYNNREKLYLANTHPTVENLRRKVTASNCKFDTIASIVSTYNKRYEFDIIFIDECSTVSNKDMHLIIDKVKFKLLVLVGDVYQIESILFGNWFSLARTFIPQTSVFELTKPHRTKNENLITVWDRVRKVDDAILESLVKNKYVSKLDEFDFTYCNDDEIILCLNYDGLYGINNVNRFLQSNNPNNSVAWGINLYKVGDPILFNESDRFAPLIYNNMKGKITDIELDEFAIRFEIELDIAITEWDAELYDFTIVGESENKNSIISFWVYKSKGTDTDNDSSKSIVPFQVAYAISIHKAQGLEYKSVKIIITNEADELITHNIFYTAITRAKEDLKIYWTPETEKKILESFSHKNHNKDAALLSNLYTL